MDDRDHLEWCGPCRFRWPVCYGSVHPDGSGSPWRYGCFFQDAYIVVTDTGQVARGEPVAAGLEWIDSPSFAYWNDDDPTPRIEVDLDASADRGRLRHVRRRRRGA